MPILKGYNINMLMDACKNFIPWMHKQLKYLSGFDPKAAKEALEVSTRNEWQSIHVKAPAGQHGYVRLSKPAHTDEDHAKGF